MEEPAAPLTEQAELAALIDGIVQQDSSALGRLYEVTVERVYSLAYALTGAAADAEEVVDDVYLQIWQRALSYDAKRGPVIAWLLVNCRSLALDLLRRRKAQHDKQARFFQQVAQPNDQAIDGITADTLITVLHQRSVVHKALSELPDIQCRLIALAFFRDLSHAEIATAVNLPLGTVKSHIRRGLQRLRDTMDR